MKPYYEKGGITLYLGDCREIAPLVGLVDVVVADPPYVETKLRWDRRCEGWLEALPTKSLWCFGSMQFFMNHANDFAAWGAQSQNVVWEKHNGSNSAKDRFRRVHEHAVHFYRGAWNEVFHEPVHTMDAVARRSHRRQRPTHWGSLGDHIFTSEDGGPRLMRSVIYARSCHGYAIHPTQKPVDLVRPLVSYACPPRGTLLDPFGGSCTSLVVARELGMRGIAIEIDEAMCEKAAKRLEQPLQERLALEVRDAEA